MYHIIGQSFIISKETSDLWCNNAEYVKLWLRNTNNWLNDQLNVCGYLSYETICKALGIRPKAWEIMAYKPLLKEQLPNHSFKFDDILIDARKNIWKVTVLEA